MAKGKKAQAAAAGDVATNRQASFRYNLLERFECGIVLEGTEVKSLRDGGAQLKDSYASIRDGEVWLYGLYIPPYGPAAATTTSPSVRASCCCTAVRSSGWRSRANERGLTLVPTRLYFAGPRSRAKVEIALAQGQGPVRQAPGDQVARHRPRDPAGAARSRPLSGRGPLFAARPRNRPDRAVSSVAIRATYTEQDIPTGTTGFDVVGFVGVVASRGPGRPRKTPRKTISADSHEYALAV